MIALLIRREYIINALYKAAWLTPFLAPLRARDIFAKIYEFGGVHSGAACSSVIWFCLLTSFLSQQIFTGKMKIVDLGLIIFTYALLILLLALVITALPRIRFKFHNTFENVHRWAGWLSLLRIGSTELPSLTHQSTSYESY
jgi:hypothetical protein